MKRKKWTAFILSATMVFTCCATAFAQDETENVPVQADAVQDDAEISELPETDKLKTAETAETPETDMQDDAEAAEAPDADVQDDAEAAETPDANVQDDATSVNAVAEISELQPLYKTDAAAETMEAASENTLTLASDEVDNGWYEITAWVKDGKDQVTVGEVIDLSTDLEYQVNYCYWDESGEYFCNPVNMENETDMQIRLPYKDNYCWDYAEGSDADDLLPALKRTSVEESVFEIDLEKLNEQGEWEWVDYSTVTIYSVNYDITYTASYGENSAGSYLFYDSEAVFELSTTDHSNYDLPEECSIEWVIDDYYDSKTTAYTNVGESFYYTPSKPEDNRFVWFDITANVYYTDNDTGENLIATYSRSYGILDNGYSYTSIELEDEDCQILVGETIDLAKTATVLTTTYSVEYPDGYITNAEIVNLQLNANWIPTYDENGNEDEWIYENDSNLDEKIVHIDGTAITGLAYGEVDLDVICKDVNGNESIGSVHIWVDPNTQTPTDDNKTTPSAGGSAVNTNNADSTTAAANTGSTDPTTATTSTGSTDSATSPKTSDVNYMRYIILLVAAFGTLTVLSMKTRKKTN